MASPGAALLLVPDQTPAPPEEKEMNVSNVLKLMRGSVRPLVTFLLVASFVAAAVSVLLGAPVERAEFAVTALGAPSMLVLGFWYKERDQRRENGTD
jgi:hypothetical protein